MLNKRWYDQDPTISMAVSLLRNIASADQAKICNVIFENLYAEGIVDASQRVPAHRRATRWSLFDNRRETLDDASWHLLELIKPLGRDVHLDVALTIIELTYRLDAGIGVYLEAADNRSRTFAETG